MQKNSKLRSVVYLINFVSDHNRIHAADVLHVCYYLSTQSIPYFVSTPNEKNAKLVGMLILKIN